MPASLRLKDIPDGENPKEFQRKIDLIYEKLLARRDVLIQDDAERLFYADRARAYLKDFPMLNPSSDLDDLHAMLIEMIMQNRMIAASKNNAAVLGDEYNDSMKRMNQLKESIATRRVDRKKMPEKQEDFARVLQEIFNISKDSIQQEDEELKIEEQKFVEEKKIRDKELGLEESHG